MPIRSILAFKLNFPICPICSEPVELETTKVHTAGKPVHEERCALKVSLRKATSASVTAREGCAKQ